MASISAMASFPAPLICSASLRRPKRGMVASRAILDPAAAEVGAEKPRPWWAPLFPGIIPDPAGSRGAEPGEVGAEGKDGEAATRKGRSVLTAEKARALRRRMRETESWHDAMYHSAIASRLASEEQY